MADIIFEVEGAESIEIQYRIQYAYVAPILHRMSTVCIHTTWQYCFVTIILLSQQHTSHHHTIIATFRPPSAPPSGNSTRQLTDLWGALIVQDSQQAEGCLLSNAFGGKSPER